MDITRATNALKSTINTVEADIDDILQSGDFYCTEEIARELNAIRNGLEHMRLDSTLLASDEWQESFNPRNMAAALAGATSVLDRAAARLFDYKSQLGAVPIGQIRENEQREMHQWAMTTLQQIGKDLEPYAYGATDRIRQFGDHVGVTDRYTGYRNNLTRGTSEPVKMETYWMDKDCKTGFMNPASKSYTTSGILTREAEAQRPQMLKSYWGSVEPDRIGSLGAQIRFSNDRAPMTIYRGYRTIDSLYSRSNTLTAPGVRAGGAPNFSEHVENTLFLNNMNAALAAQEEEAARNTPTSRQPGKMGQDSNTPGHVHRTMSVQEQAGINTTFPGRTEYMQRYAAPSNTTCCSDFLINPKPDMQICGRPLGQARYDPNFTEYQKRYEWPDGNKLPLHPWAR